MHAQEMTNKETILAIVQKAVNGGWKAPEIEEARSGNDEQAISSVVFALANPKHRDLIVGQFLHNPHVIIYAHDFAKAFWGEEQATIVWYNGTKPFSFEEDGRTWQIHLMKMVLEENPIPYLAKFL